jgi:hypothetical protein
LIGQRSLPDLNKVYHNLTAENEIVEFKEAKPGYDFNKIGKYFSALSNEANLKTIGQGINIH